MNTPEPCSSCKNLYYDVFSKNDIDCYIECTKGLKIGNKNCKEYENWKKTKKPVDNIN